VSAYSLLKLVHIISAIVAVGANVSYFVWFSRVKGEPQPEQVFALRGIKTLDAWLANPRAFIPKSRMTFPGIEDAKTRADLIAFLRSLSVSRRVQ